MTTDHPFLLEEQYFDRRGNYIVLAVAGDKITIRYEDGEEAVVPIDIKARIYANMIGEDRVRHPHQSTKYFRTLGFLSRHADFHAEVIPRLQGTFEHRYELIARRVPERNRYGYYTLQKDADKWGMELRLYYPARVGLEFPPNVHPRSGRSPDTCRINHNRYWWQLVTVGFRLGTNHDRNQIERNVPPQFRGAFLKGARKET